MGEDFLNVIGVYLKLDPGFSTTVCFVSDLVALLSLVVAAVALVVVAFSFSSSSFFVPLVLGSDALLTVGSSVSLALVSSCKDFRSGSWAKSLSDPISLTRSFSFDKPASFFLLQVEL